VPKYLIYGITLETDLILEWPVQSTTAARDVQFTCTYTPPADLAWGTATPVHVISAADGESVHVSFHQFDDIDVIRFEGLMDHYLWPDRIVCHLHRPELLWLVEIQLLGMVLALWLERNGMPTLHASACVVNGTAVACLGTKGGGKTTAATALAVAGHPLLVDDLLALRLIADEVFAQPGYPLLRLWPEQADHFIGEHETLPLVHPSFTKRRVIVGEQVGAFHTDAAPLRRVYLPERNSGGEIVIERVSPREALIALIRHSFIAEAVNGYGLAEARFRAFIDVMHTVRVRRLSYPNGFEHLTELVAAIERDLTDDQIDPCKGE
jgi:hypothetical protein